MSATAVPDLHDQDGDGSAPKNKSLPETSTVRAVDEPECNPRFPDDASCFVTANVANERRGDNSVPTALYLSRDRSMRLLDGPS